MSDEIFRHEKNLGVILVPVGIVGLIGCFWTTVVAAQARTGMSSQHAVLVSILFVVSILLTALGSQVKVISSLTGGLADGEEE